MPAFDTGGKIVKVDDWLIQQFKETARTGMYAARFPSAVSVLLVKYLGKKSAVIDTKKFREYSDSNYGFYLSSNAFADCDLEEVEYRCSVAPPVFDCMDGDNVKDRNEWKGAWFPLPGCERVKRVITKEVGMSINIEQIAVWFPALETLQTNATGFVQTLTKLKNHLTILGPRVEHARGLYINYEFCTLVFPNMLHSSQMPVSTRAAAWKGFFEHPEQFSDEQRTAYEVSIKNLGLKVMSWAIEYGERMLLIKLLKGYKFSPSTYNKLITIANEKGDLESAALLMDVKDKNVDEERYVRTKVSRETNALSDPFHADNIKKAGWKYRVNESGITLTDCARGAGFVNEVVVPERVGKRPVTVLGPDLMSYRSFRKVVVPETVTTIGSRAFSGNSSMEECVLNEGLTYIGDECFNGACFKSIRLPSTLIRIGARAFCATALESIVIPEGVKDIGAECFADCSDLQRVILPSTLVSIKHNTFRGCTKLFELEIPENVQLEESAFSNCYVKVVRIPKAVTVLAESLFASARIQRVVLHEGVEEIDENAFLCANIQEIEFPDGLRSVGSRAFSECEMKSVFCQAPFIGKQAFSGCLAESAELPNAVLIPESAFAGCHELKKFVGRKVTMLASECFARCHKLTEIHIGEPMYVDKKAFDGLFNMSGREPVRVFVPKGVDLERARRVMARAFENGRKPFVLEHEP